MADTADQIERREFEVAMIRETRRKLAESQRLLRETASLAEFSRERACGAQ